MMTKSRKDMSIEEWLEQNRPEPRCLTCRHDGVRELLREILQTMIKSRKRVKRDRIHAHLREKFPDYTARRDAFNNHLRLCEADLWEALKSGGQ